MSAIEHALPCLVWMILISGPAASTGEEPSREAKPPANAPPLARILELLEDRGVLSIDKVEFERGNWQIRGYSRGRLVRYVVNPATGAIRKRRPLKIGSAADVAHVIRARGYDRIREMEFEDGRWEVETERNGRQVSVLVNVKKRRIREQPGDAAGEDGAERSLAAEWSEIVHPPIWHVPLEARNAFYRGEFAKARERLPQPDKSLPVVDEFSALVAFADGRYGEAAKRLDSSLSESPGWDWSTMITLYPDVETYTRHFRALEAHHGEHPDDRAARFVLAYHYLKCGYPETAEAHLRALAEQHHHALAGKLLSAIYEK